LHLVSERAEQHLELLRQCEPNASRSGYRMLENPFFLKLCPRMQFNAESDALVRGMYLPLDYWKLIEADDSMTGPRGGRIVSYANVGRYFDNTSFITLVANAWVGTTIEQSAILERLTREVLSTGRTVTFAVKSTKSEPLAETIMVPVESDEQEPPLQTVPI